MAVESKIGPYIIIRHIKRGGQGRVYLGYDRRLRRKVAIKVCPLPAYRRERRKALREAQRAASIQSARVVQIYDVIESRDHLAMVMEYVSGCDLEELLGKTRLSVASVLTIGRDLAVALAAARQQQVVHGDLKAANVLITDYGRVKLADFGVARAPCESDSSPRVGSLEALSPEQWRGEALDVRSDLFALGCLLYRLLGGVRPFYRSGQFDAALLLEQDPPPLREMVPREMELPRELEQLVAELLRKRPDDRPADTHRVRRLISAALRRVPLSISDELLRQARPWFRLESPEDVPPLIPSDLRSKGRSRLEGPRWWKWFRQQSMAIKFSMGSVSALVLGVPLVYALHQPTLSVHFKDPVIAIVNDQLLPAEVSARWLVEEVRFALEEMAPRMRVSGAAPITTYYSDEAGGGTDNSQQLQISLRCSEVLCVLGLVRQGGESAAYEQALLLSDMPLAQWRAVVRGRTRALFE